MGLRSAKAEASPELALPSRIRPQGTGNLKCWICRGTKGYSSIRGGSATPSSENISLFPEKRGGGRGERSIFPWQCM